MEDDTGTANPLRESSLSPNEESRYFERALLILFLLSLPLVNPWVRGATDVPPFVIGRPGWDNWLLWRALSSGARLIDASPVVTAVHQNHDYGYHPDGEQGVWQGEEAQANYALLENYRKFATLDDATHVLGNNGVQPNRRRHLVHGVRAVGRACDRVWFGLLSLTRPIRHRLSLKQKVKA